MKKKKRKHNLTPSKSKKSTTNNNSNTHQIQTTINQTNKNTHTQKKKRTERHTLVNQFFSLSSLRRIIITGRVVVVVVWHLCRPSIPFLVSFLLGPPPPSLSSSLPLRQVSKFFFCCGEDSFALVTVIPFLFVFFALFCFSLSGRREKFHLLAFFSPAKLCVVVCLISLISLLMMITTTDVKRKRISRGEINPLRGGFAAAQRERERACVEPERENKIGKTDRK